MAARSALRSLEISLDEFLNFHQPSSDDDVHDDVPTHLNLLRSAYHETEQLRISLDSYDSAILNTPWGRIRRRRRWGEREKAFLQQIRDVVWRLDDMFDDFLITNHHSGRTPEVYVKSYLRLIYTILMCKLTELPRLIGSASANHQPAASLELEFTPNFQAEIISFVQVLANARQELKEAWDEKICSEEESHDYYYDGDNDYEIDGEAEEIVEYKADELRSTGNYGMVGLVDHFIQLRLLLLFPPDDYRQVSILGMAGIGKTAMANQLFTDPFISKRYRHRAFVTVGRFPQWKQIYIDILSQLQYPLDVVKMQRMSVTKLSIHLDICMVYNRCLIVFDDLWDDMSFEGNYRSNPRGTRVLVTTRKKSVASVTGGEMIELPLLDEKGSWRLFCDKVFGKDSPCPHKFLEVGHKIVENCEGLPLAIVAIADILLQGDMTVDHWKKVSDDPNPLSIGTNDQHPSLNTLYSSYDELEQSLRACFLYMGIFPRRHEIPVSKLTRLWEAERLVRPQYYLSPEQLFPNNIVSGIIKGLSSQSVIFVTLPTLQEGFKTCRLHSVFWHLCVSQARTEYIVQVVDKFSEKSFEESLNVHRRICVQNNTLFGIRDANKSMLSMSNARSLLCTGPYHLYHVPMEFKMRLLRVLDVVTIRFYTFPSEVVQLVLLRYLAFTYNGKLHGSISQLCNLEFLIVEHHMRIISLEDPLYMPVEIWNMNKLRHLQVTGALLPRPPKGAILRNLFSISKINAKCLTAAVFDSIPNLWKLSIEIDLSAPDPFCFSDHLSRVDALCRLKCVVLNPRPRSQTIEPPPPSKIFPLKLRKLTLSGFGYPWKYFEEFAGFESLRVLKLRSYAFQGPEWKLSAGYKFEVLHLEDLDLVDWRASSWLCKHLIKKLSIRHCYKLRAIPSTVDGNLNLELIELVEVQPSVVASAKNIVRQRRNFYYGALYELSLNVNCSCEDGN